MKAKSQLEVDVIISAYNEQLCIDDILQDVTLAKQSSQFVIQNIYVISDASADQTDDIVQQFSHRDERVKLIRKAKRKGKSDSINKAFNITKSDVLIFLDSDVRLASENVLSYMVEPIYRGQAELVGANVIPVDPGFTLNPAILARYFDALLEKEFRRKKSNSYWGAYGRAFAISGDFFQKLVLPPSHADDLFIYYSCLRKGYRQAFVKEAVVYFEAPKSIGDFIRQYGRFDYYTEKAREEFGKDLVDNDMKVPGTTGFLLLSFILYPYHGLIWAICRLASTIACAIGLNADKLDKGLYKTRSKRVETNWNDAVVSDR